MKRKELRLKVTKFRRRIYISLRNNQWRFALYGIFVVFVLGIWGYTDIYSKGGTAASIWDIFYNILQFFVLGFDTALNNQNLQLEIARWLAPAIAAVTAASGLALIFKEQWHIFRAQFLRKHIIICGLGRKGLILSRRFVAAGFRVVVIENDENNENLKQCRESGAIVLIGNAMEPGPLRKARLKKAEHLVCMCGDDGVNAGIVFRAGKILPARRRRPLNCIVHIVDTQLFHLIKERGFKTSEKDVLRLLFLNIFDLAAKVIMELFPPFKTHEGKITESPHLLVVGLGNMGESVVSYAAANWMNFADKPGGKMKISIIDREAGKKKELMQWRYPGLSQICKLEPLEMDINSKEFEEGRFLFNWRKKCSVSAIYICLDDDSFALRTALSLNQHLREQDIPIVVRMDREAGFAPLVEGKSHGFANIRVFGFLDWILKPEVVLFEAPHEILARSIHEEYCRYQREKGETQDTNPSITSWEELPETLKNSNRRQAVSLARKLNYTNYQIVPLRGVQKAQVEFSDEEIEIMAKIEHVHWMAERLKDGWKYGPKKDIDKKISPSLVPWDQLPEDEKDKDRNPVRETPRFLAKAGFRIYRRKNKK